MKVKELIKKLQEMNPDQEVRVETEIFGDLEMFKNSDYGVINYVEQTPEIVILGVLQGYQTE